MVDSDGMMDPEKISPSAKADIVGYASGKTFYEPSTV